MEEKNCPSHILERLANSDAWIDAENERRQIVKNISRIQQRFERLEQIKKDLEKEGIDREYILSKDRGGEFIGKNEFYVIQLHAGPDTLKKMHDHIKTNHPAYREQKNND